MCRVNRECTDIRNSWLSVLNCAQGFTLMMSRRILKIVLSTVQ